MRRIAALLFAVLLAPAGGGAGRLSQPSPITLITPYPPGGATDFLARTLAEGLKTRLSQTVLVQNVGGAGGTVGSLQAAKAKPDGYTLLLHHIGMSTIPALYKKLAFDPLAAYEFIGVFAEAPMMILARQDFAPRNFAEAGRLRQGQRGEVHRRLRRHGQRHASLRHAVPGGARHAAHRGAVQGRRAGGDRCALGSGRHHLRPADDQLGRHPLGRSQGLMC